MRPLSLDDRIELAFELGRANALVGELERCRYYFRQYETLKFIKQQDELRGIEVHRRAMMAGRKLRKKQKRWDGRPRRKRGSLLNPDDPFASGGPTGVGRRFSVLDGGRDGE